MVTLPLMLLSGWMVKIDGGATVLWPFQWISSIKYGFNLLVKVLLISEFNRMN
jgi:hypothetical protein